MAMIPFNTLDKLDPRGKRILLRVDLNVPMKDGVISDFTRIERIVPTIRELADKGGRVIVLSHFDRPKGKVVPDMSLQPIATALATALGKPVSFAHDCIGPDAEAAAASLKDGEVLLLENTRFQPGEETNAPDLSAALANLGDVYVNDAFSAAHRAHASTAGVAEHLPAYAGRLMEAEIAALDAALENPERPVGAIVGGQGLHQTGTFGKHARKSGCSGCWRCHGQHIPRSKRLQGWQVFEGRRHAGHGPPDHGAG